MSDDAADEKVGYGRPPERTRWRKGQSGNPKGRPKRGNDFEDALLAAMSEKVVVTENGTRRRITKLEAALKQLANKGAAGDMRTVKLMIEEARRAKAARPEPVEPSLDEDDRSVVERIVGRIRQGGA